METKETDRAEVTTAEQPRPTQAPKQKPHKKLLGIVAIVVGSLLLLGGVSALAYNVWYQNPDKVVHDAVIRAVTAESVVGTGTLAVANENFTLEVAFDTQAAAASSQADVTATITAKNEDFSLDLAGSGLVKDGTFYFKLDNVDEIIAAYEDTLGGVAPIYVQEIVDTVNGQWISVDPSDFEKMNEVAARQQECVTDALKTLETDRDMQREVTNLYRDNRIVVVHKKLGSASVDGTGSLGYSVKFNATTTESFIRSLDETAFGQSLKECNNDIDFNEIADDFAESIRENAQDAPEFTIELWVSRFGHEVTRVAVSGGDNETTVEFELKPTFNQDVTIDAPEDAVSIQELMDEIQSAVDSAIRSQYSHTYRTQPTMLDPVAAPRYL